MKLLIIRHGETGSNKEKRIQGHTNESINKKGILQMRRLVPYLKNKKIDLIISSDLTRAKESAKILAKGLDIRTIKYYKITREKNNGKFTGRKATEIDWESVKGTFETRKAPGGESLKEVLRRVKVFLGILKRKYQKKSILLVSHGTFIKILVGHIENKNIIDSILKRKIRCGELIAKQW